MSLEQALADNTAALKALTAALLVLPQAGTTVAAASLGDEKPKRAKKATEPAVEQPTTKYYFSEKNDVVYQVQPGEPDVVMGGAVAITKEEFEAHQARLSAKFAHLSAPGNAPAATPAADAPEAHTPSQSEPAAAVEVSNEVLMKAVVSLSQLSDGRARMEKILAHFGVPKFSLLPAQRRAEALSAVEKALAE